jgi:DNA topoisomerase II
MSSKETNKKSGKDKSGITKYTHVEHVLKVSDTYVGSMDKTEEEIWVYADELKKMEKRKITYTPGEYKIFDEILVNALDQIVRLKQLIQKGENLIPVKNIKVAFNKEEGWISVYNDGEGISVEKHSQEGIYIPELIFGHLLTSGNYDKKEKVTGGKNGYGGKLANIFSKQFIIETVDNTLHKKYVQTFKNNMSEKDKPKITSCKGKPYTKITYYPDFEKFGSERLTDDMITLISKRTYDAAAITDLSITIYLNDKKLECTSFEKYTDLYLGDKKEVPRLYQEINDRWAICVALNPTQQFEQVSFVNGITTYQGGKHVEYITNQVTKKLGDYILKKKKVTVKPAHIKENIFVFIRCLVNDPSFNSQVKEFLTTPMTKFGSKCDLDTKFIDKLAKMGLMETAMNLSAFKENKDLKKSDGKKKTNIRGIPKLDDANWAGTAKSHLCTLILTEGDSAKALAISGLSVIGRDKYGVFPLKGKVLNVKGEDKNLLKKIGENTEIVNLKKIIGLQSGKKYESVNDLRYGSVMLLTDQDEDGSHIKGLLFNLFQTLWPELFRLEGFNKSMLTPIVKATRGKQVKSFYNLSDYDNWKEKNDGQKGWSIKYYKGLGTSTPKEAKEYFKDMKIVNYKFVEETSDEAIELAFNKKLADKRKDWLANHDKNKVLDYTKSDVTHDEFINYEMIHFSNSDNKRSLPCLIDGLKTSHRKILFSAFKKKLLKEIRVAQFAGYVSEHAGYHHGEMSLQGAIVNMAQDFIGSNNINILEPVGQFGTRIMGGSDSAQPRYIHTHIPDIIPYIYIKEDFNVLKYNDDDGNLVEPEYYIPIIPMILVNGSEGIGTGWSSFIPSFNPLEIIENIKIMVNNYKKSIEDETTTLQEGLNEMKPWYRGYTGTIEKLDEKRYISRGRYNVVNDTTIEITELPIRTWTDKYKEFMETMIIDNSKDKGKKKEYIRNYTSQCTDSKVHFKLTLHPDDLDDLTYYKEQNDDGQNIFERVFKLTSKISMTNMVMYDDKGFLKKYDTVNDILENYFMVRLNCYIKRKEYQLESLKSELVILNARVRFILEFIKGDIIISNRTKQNLLDQLKDRDYPTVEDNYDYLIKMPIYNLTKERIDELNKDKDMKTEMYSNLEEKETYDIWLEELDILSKQYKKFLVVKEKENEEEPKKVKIKGK